MTRTAFTLALVVAPALAAAQTIVPPQEPSFASPADRADFYARLVPGTPVAGRADCMWQWAAERGGWFWRCGVDVPLAPVPTTTPSPTVTDDDCAHINPYVDQATALACVFLHPEPDAPGDLPVFQVGRRYRQPYPAFRMVVLSVTRSLDGVEVVTYQWLATNTEARIGDVAACRNDGGSCGPWVLEQ